MGNSCYECSDLHCDLDLSIGSHAKQQAHEASGASQAGIGHELVLESQPKDIPLTHNFRGGQPYLTEGSSAPQMSSSSHRHQADVLKVQRDRLEAERQQREAAEQELQQDLQQVWAEVGDDLRQEFIHWDSQCTVGYDAGPTLEIELKIFLLKAASLVKQIRDLPGHMDPRNLQVQLEDAIAAVRLQIHLMVEDQTGWLMPVVN